MLETGTQECARPIYLARELTDCGITEAEGCVRVVEAIEKELIVPCQDPEIHSHDSVDWALFDDK